MEAAEVGPIEFKEAVTTTTNGGGGVGRTGRRRMLFYATDVVTLMDH